MYGGRSVYSFDDAEKLPKQLIENETNSCDNLVYFDAFLV